MQSSQIITPLSRLRTVLELPNHFRQAQRRMLGNGRLNAFGCRGLVHNGRHILEEQVNPCDEDGLAQEPGERGWVWQLLGSQDRVLIQGRIFWLVEVEKVLGEFSRKLRGRRNVPIPGHRRVVFLLGRSCVRWSWLLGVLAV